jgi:hypothetical protein
VFSVYFYTFHMPNSDYLWVTAIKIKQIHIYTGNTQTNGAVLIVFTINTAPFFCVCPVFSLNSNFSYSTESCLNKCRINFARPTIFKAQQPNLGLGRLVWRFLDHAQTDTHSVGLLWTSDQSVAEADTYTKTQEKNTHALGGIRTLDPSTRAVADLRLRPVVPKVDGTASWGAVGLPRWALIVTRGGRERCYYLRGALVDK